MIKIPLNKESIQGIPGKPPSGSNKFHRLKSKTCRSSSVNMKEAHSKANQRELINNKQELIFTKKSNSKERRDAFGNQIVRGGNHKISFKDEIGHFNLEEILNTNRINVINDEQSNCNLSKIKEDSKETNEVIYHNNNKPKKVENLLTRNNTSKKFQIKMGSFVGDQIKRKAPSKIGVYEIPIKANSKGLNTERDSSACQNCVVF